MAVSGVKCIDGTDLTADELEAKMMPWMTAEPLFFVPWLRGHPLLHVSGREDKDGDPVFVYPFSLAREHCLNYLLCVGLDPQSSVDIAMTGIGASACSQNLVSTVLRHPAPMLDAKSASTRCRCSMECGLLLPDADGANVLMSWPSYLFFCIITWFEHRGKARVSGSLETAIKEWLQDAKP